MIFNLLDAHCRLVGSFSTKDKALEAMKNYREALGGLGATISYTKLDEDQYLSENVAKPTLKLFYSKIKGHFMKDEKDKFGLPLARRICCPGDPKFYTCIVLDRDQALRIF